MEPYAKNREHLKDELLWLDQVLLAGVESFRTSRSDWGGLVITDELVNRLLAGGPDQDSISTDGKGFQQCLVELRQRIDQRTEAATSDAVALRLPRLARLFDLSTFERHVILLCLAPELDLKYERIYAYLQDD